MTNQELIEAYLNSIALLSKKTIALYSVILKTFAAACDKSFLELTANDMRAYIIEKKSSNKWKKANTIATHIRTLKTFFRFLIAENLLKEENNPTKNIKAPPCYLDGEVRTLTAEEIKKTLKAAESPMIELRTRLLFYLALTTGLRASEIISIKKKNVDLEKRLIYIPKEDVKGQYREKCVPIISSRTRELIDAYYSKYPNNTEYLFSNVFGRKLSYQLLYLAIKEVIDVAFPYKNSWTKPYGPHIARHTFASRWIESGGEAAALKTIMGWRSFKQYDRYVNVSPSYISKAAHKVERKLLKV